MLHGGKVLMGKKDSVTNTIKWYPSVLNPFVETSESILIVIDDIYCTYRTALAEGKQLQVNLAHLYAGTFACLDNNGCYWQDYTTGNFILQPHCYRIKPEEPELKVGDWITVNGPAGTFIECISGINDDTYVLSGTNICYKSQATKWEPREGDLCVVWDNDDIACAVIIKFDYIDASSKYSCSDTLWDNCMPFTGILPPHMRDNK